MVLEIGCGDAQEWELVRVAVAERAEAVGAEGRVVGRIDCPAGTIGNGTSKKHSEDAVVDGARLSVAEGEEDQITVVIEVGIAEQREEPEIDPASNKVSCNLVS